MDYTSNHMNILIVCPRLCHGGAERVAVCLANGFIEHGHQVRFMTDLFEEQSYVLDKRVKVINLVTTANNKIRKWGSAIKIVRKETKKTRPNVIIGILPLCSLISKIATIGTNIPVIATEHNSFERPLSAPMPKLLWVHKFYINKIFDGVTVLTKADKKIVDTKLKNVRVMPNPLSTKPTNTISAKQNIILAAGRVDNWHVKGFDVLIKSWKKIQDLNDNVNDDDNLRDWWLKIAGVWRSEDTIPFLTGLIPDGEWIYNDGENHCKEWLWRSEKYHIEFLGFQENMEELYKKSDIFVLSSRYEGFGLVLIEAMSQGCAPIACDYKGRQKEILCPEGDSSFKSQDSSLEICENGILCEPDNVEALAQAIKRMIKDEEYRKMVQRNVVERSNFYDMEHTIDRWEKYLKEITTNNI